MLCLEGSVISSSLPSSGGSPGPVYPICAQKWPKPPFISFLPLNNDFIRPTHITCAALIRTARGAHYMRKMTGRLTSIYKLCQKNDGNSPENHKHRLKILMTVLVAQWLSGSAFDSNTATQLLSLWCANKKYAKQCF